MDYNAMTIDDIVAFGSALDMANLNYDLAELQGCGIMANYAITTDGIKIIDASLIPNTPEDITNAIRKEI